MDSVQLIDEHKHFSQNVSKFLDATHMKNAGLDYHVVSVFGSQSTGKSTLLNALFRTKFQVMDETQRAQTTKGIWMAKADMGWGHASKRQEETGGGGGASGESSASTDPESDGDREFVKVRSNSIGPGSKRHSSTKQLHGSNGAIMVLDVEGTDGRERGDDQDFERRSALFALATSEVLIVNMWEHQVGLYQGANMGLLKTVFEVNLSLFQSSGQTRRSLIMFVIRDHIGTTPLENLAKSILEDLDRHWQSISKPTPELESSKIGDFFDIQFHALPHKVLLPEKFELGVAEIKKRFSSETADASEYVFKPEYHRQVPIDGWPMYASGVWEQIELNKDLDLPTQQMLVARFRCEEIATESWHSFEDALSGYGQAGLFQTPVDTFGPEVGTARTQALKHFDGLASRYDQAVYHEKRAELLSRIDSKILTLYKAQLGALHKHALILFDELTSKREKGVSFADMLETARTKVLVDFVEDCRKATVDEHVFSFADQLALLNTELDEAELSKQRAQIQTVVDRASRKISRIFAEELDTFFRKPSDKTWDQVHEFFNHTFDTVLEPYDGGRNFKVGANEETNLKGRNQVRAAAWVALDMRLRELTKTENVVLRLRMIFERAFKYDKNDVPIVWKPSDDIEGPYLRARDSTLKFVDVFALAKLSNGELLEPDVAIDGDDFDADAEGDFARRLSESRKQEIVTEFKRQADITYVEAKRSTTMEMTRVPFYVIVLIVILGWNEFMAVMRNPLLILFALMVGASAYVTYSLDLWGPMMSVGQAMSNRALEVGKEWLREALKQPETSHQQYEKPIELKSMSSTSSPKSDFEDDED